MQQYPPQGGYPQQGYPQQYPQREMRAAAAAKTTRSEILTPLTLADFPEGMTPVQQKQQAAKGE